MPLGKRRVRSEEHTSELQSLRHLVCRLLLEKKKIIQKIDNKSQISISQTRYSSSGSAVAGPDTKVNFSHTDRSLCFLGFKSFFFNDTATTEIYTLSLHDALSI